MYREQADLDALIGLMNTIVDGVIAIDAAGNIVDFNPACERLFGYSAEEVLSKNVSMLMPEPYRGEHDRYLRDYAETGVRKIIGIGREVTGRRKDGSTFPMELSVGEVQRSGEVRERAFVGVIRDITARVRLEQELRDSDALHRAIIETAVDGMIIIDLLGTVRVFNPASVAMFGYAVEEVVGRNVKMLMPSPFHDDHDTYLRAYVETGERKVIGIGREVIGRRKDGTTFPIELSVGETRTGGQRLFVGILRDITEKKRAEEALRQSQADLRARIAEVAQMAEETGRARQVAEDANEAKSNFLAVMSHEIRTPMSGVLGMVDALDATGLTVAQRKMIAIIREAGEDLVGILNNILDISKIDGGYLKLQPEPVRMVELLTYLRDLWAPRVNARGLAFRVEHEFGEEDTIEVDAGRLKQILSNLLGNACKFTDTGEIVVRCAQKSLDDGRIRMRFEVSDTGVGIDRQQQDKLFLPYSQVMSMRDRNPSGTGLGLSISRQLVEAMGGEIGVTSEIGAGTSFWFTVPAHATKRSRVESAELAAPARAPARLRPGARVLVAEDNMTNQKVIQVLLFGANVEAVVVANGAKALEALERENFDLVLMDDNMPEMDGPATTKAIRALPGAKAGVPIVALTANSMSGDREKYLALGMNDYLSKPISMAGLLAVLEKWLVAPG